MNTALTPKATKSCSVEPLGSAEIPRAESSDQSGTSNHLRKCSQTDSESRACHLGIVLDSKGRRPCARESLHERGGRSDSAEIIVDNIPHFEFVGVLITTSRGSLFAVRVQYTVLLERNNPFQEDGSHLHCACGGSARTLWWRRRELSLICRRLVGWLSSWLAGCCCCWWLLVVWLAGLLIVFGRSVVVSSSERV